MLVLDFPKKTLDIFYGNYWWPKEQRNRLALEKLKVMEIVWVLLALSEIHRYITLTSGQ